MAIEKLRALPEITALPAVQPLQAVPKITALPSLNTSNTTANFYADYNDPYEINSFADAILNTEAIKRASEDWGWFSWVGDVPVLRELAAVIDLAWNKGIKPALSGDWKAVGVNTLVNLGETLGVVGNPVKGLLMEGPEGFAKGLGLWNPSGRVNYDWDTGSWVADIGLEILTDPLTYITLGTTSGIKSTAHSAVQTALGRTVREAVKGGIETAVKRTSIPEIAGAVENLVLEPTAQKTLKAATRTLVDYVTNTIDLEAKKELKKLSRKTKTPPTHEELVQMILSERTAELRDLIMREISSALPPKVQSALADRTSDVYKELVKYIDNILLDLRWDSLAQSIDQSLVKLHNYTDSFERFLFRSTMYTSGLGLAYKAFKPLLRPAGELINNTIIRNVRKAKTITNNNVPVLREYDKFKQVYSESYKLAKTLDPAVERSQDTFYRWIIDTFTTDRAMFDKIFQDNIDTPTQTMRALNAYVRQRQPGISTFHQYVKLVKEINTKEGGHYVEHVRFLERLKGKLKTYAAQKVLQDEPVRGVKRLYSKTNIGKSIKNIARVKKYLNTVAPEEYAHARKGLVKFVANELYYQIKIDDLALQMQTIAEPAIYDFATHVYAGTENTAGRLIHNVLQDPAAYGKDIYELSKRIYNMAYNTKMFDEFITDVYNTRFKSIEGVTHKEFKTELLNTLYSFADTRVVDIQASAATLILQLKTKLQEVLNAKHMRKDDNRIYIPYENLDIMQNMLERYARTVIEVDPEARLFFATPDDYVEVLKTYLKILPAYFQTPEFGKEVREAFIAAGRIRTQAKLLHLEEPYIRNGIFVENSATMADYNGAPMSLISALTQGLHGDAYYGVRKVLSTHNMELYYKFKEDKEYPEEILRSSDRFINLVEPVVGTLEGSSDVRYALEDLISYLNYANVKNMPRLNQLRYLEPERLDKDRLLAVMYTLRSNKFLPELADEPARDILNKWERKLAYKNKDLLIAIKSIKPASKYTRAFNPQALATLAEEIDFTDPVRTAIKEYSAALEDTQIIYQEGLTAFTNSLRERSKDSALTRVCERKVKSCKTFSDNVLHYNKNKYKDLFNKELADDIYATYAAWGFPELELLLKYYTSSPALTESEYTYLRKIMRGWYDPVSKKRVGGFNKVLRDHFKEERKARYKELLATDPVYQKTLRTIAAYNKKLERFTAKFAEARKTRGQAQANYDTQAGPLKARLTEARKQFKEILEQKLELKSKQKPRADRLLRMINAQKGNLKETVRLAYRDAPEELLENVSNIPKEVFIQAYEQDTMQYGMYKSIQNKLNKLEHAYAKLEKRLDLKQRMLDKLDKEITELENSITDLEAQFDFDANYKEIRVLYTTVGNTRTFLENQKNILEKRAKELRDQAYKEISKRFDKLKLDAPYEKVIDYNQTLRHLQDNLHKQQLLYVLGLSPEELRTELAFRPRTGVVFDASAWAKEKAVASAYKQFFEYVIPAAEPLGVRMYKDPETDLVYVYLDKSVKVSYLDTRTCIDGVEVFRKDFQLDYKYISVKDAHLGRELAKLPDQIQELTGFRPYASTGTIMDKDFLKRIYEGFSPEEIRKLIARAKEYSNSEIEYHVGLPDAVKKNLPTLDEMLEGDESRYFDIPRFDDALIGSTAMRRRIQPNYAASLITNAKNSLDQAGIYNQPKYDFINSLMDSIFSIGKGIYKGFTNAQILEGLVRAGGQYRLAYLAEDARWGFRINEIPPLNEKAIEEARRLNAVIIPYSIYVKMVNTINHRIGSSGFFKLWNRIMYLYKFGYLFSIGTIARNWVDTNLKTDLELDTDARGYKRMAKDYIRQYNDVTKIIADLNDGAVTRVAIDNFFNGVPTAYYPNLTITRETYMLLEDFFRFGPVTSLVQEPGLLDMGDGDLWRTFANVTTNLMTHANWTEAHNRLAIYLADLDKGITKQQSWTHITNVHFDYAFKTPVEQLLETIFPFSTFMFRNITYWLDLLERHPEFMPLFRDIYTPILNFDELSTEQLNASWALQYQIVNGAIPLFEVNDVSYNLRLNPSILDALHTVINPLTIIQNKLADPINTLFTAVQGTAPDTTALPVVGVAQQRIQKAIKEQNLLPSLITKRSTAPSTAQYSQQYRYTGIQNTSNPYYVLPKIRTDSRIDPYKTIGVRAFTSRMMAAPKVKVKVNVYDKVYYKHHTDVYNGIRYQLRLNINKFR